ncbi:MAG: single-stranded-DNA-specific exonuclease RecJ [Rhodospirillales bacterium]|nr:single-stranded-DNA-specific exonuclease RecJ [Rhodospirillales bacterium]
MAEERPDGPFLGVERSLGGCIWRLRPAKDRIALTLSQRLGLPEVVGRAMASRGIDPEEAEHFLHPTLRQALPDPSHLKGMDTAAERLATAVVQGEKIAVFGDYDVDGAASSALLCRYLGAVGSRTRIYIPDRIHEGYGPNEKAIAGLGREGVSLIVTVDCGTTAHEPLAAAAASGLDVIVADHHEAEAALPEAVAVVNPNRLDEDSPHGHMAAVGVTFLLAVALNRALRGAGYFENRDEPDLMALLDLVALGTVCDVVPLTGVNRAFVARGLDVLAGRRNVGLRALSDVAGIDERPGTYHAGYMLGPRINAGGRIGQADLGARLLTTDNEVEARDIAERLNALNRERQDLEARVLEQALSRAETSGAADGDSVILVADPAWHAGVIGIVAGRLAERFSRPACVVAIDGDQAVGSGRSVSGVDLGAAIIAARQSGLLERGGGHAMAAGFTADPGRLEALGDFLDQRLRADIAAATAARAIHLDGAVTARAATMDLVSELARIAPFGVGNPEPRFAVPNVRVGWAKVVGANHLSCTLTDADGSRLKAIAFRAMDNAIGPALLNNDGAPFHVAGKLRINSWRGTDSVQMVIDDAAPAW